MNWSELIAELDDRLGGLAASLADPDDDEITHFDDVEFPETPMPPQQLETVAALLDRVNELKAETQIGLDRIGTAIDTTPLLEAANRAYLTP